MTRSYSECIDELRQLVLHICQHLELAEARVYEIDEVIEELATLQLADESAVLGEIIYDRQYLPGQGPTDSSQLTQAALMVPYGFGVVLWDMNDYAVFRRSPPPPKGAVNLNFVPFDECSLAIKALLLSQLGPLLDRLCQRIRPLPTRQ